MNQLIVSDPPYGTISYRSYVLMDPRKVTETRTWMAERGISPNCKIILITTVWNDERYITIPPDSTWSGFTASVLAHIRASGYKNPMDIHDITFSNNPYYNPVFTRVVHPHYRPPYYCFPDGAIVYVNMLRRSCGWVPIITGHVGCHVCGKMETRECKTCIRCKKTKYCSLHCQTTDWKTHRHKCM